MMQVKQFQVNPFQENTYLLFDDMTHEAALIDCGCLSSDEWARVKEVIDAENLTVKLLLNTHMHLDHCFGNHFVAQTYGVLPQGHRDDEFLIEQMPMQAQLFGVPVEVHPQPMGGYLIHDDEIHFGQISLLTLYVPGHSPGSLCFYCQKEKVVFVGDVLFNGSIGRTDLPKGNYAQLISGIQQQLLTLPDDTTVFCGHGPHTTIGHERLNNPFL